MSNPPLHGKLAHLTNEQVIELISEYYAKKPVTDLIQRFNIDCLSSQLYKLFPPEISTELCPNCGAPMVLPRISKNAYRTEHKHGLRCSQCEHRAKGSCFCGYCLKKSKQGIQSSARKVAEINTPDYRQPTGGGQINAYDLNLEQAVSLLALTRCYGTATIKNGMSLCSSKMLKAPFAPSSGYGEEVLNRLVDARLLRFFHQSNPHAFSLSDNKLALSYMAQWSLPSAVSLELIRDIESLVSQCNWPAQWYEQVSELAFDLAFAECKEFYDFCASERMFPNADNKSVTAMLRNLLADFSTGQCFRIIQSGAQYAADFLVKQSATPRHAANYMVGACQRWADKARANDWSVTPFRRNFNCPRSMMSYVLHDFFLKANDDGLNTPIDLVALPKQAP